MYNGFSTIFILAKIVIFFQVSSSLLINFYLLVGVPLPSNVASPVTAPAVTSIMSAHSIVFLQNLKRTKTKIKCEVRPSPTKIWFEIPLSSCYTFSDKSVRRILIYDFEIKPLTWKYSLAWFPPFSWVQCSILLGRNFGGRGGGVNSSSFHEQWLVIEPAYNLLTQYCIKFKRQKKLTTSERG